MPLSGYLRGFLHSQESSARNLSNERIGASGRTVTGGHAPGKPLGWDGAGLSRKAQSTPREGISAFFYADHLGADNLFRGVVEAVLGLDAQTLRREPKARILAELQERGLWLIDAVDEPVNHLPMPERRQRVGDGVEGLVERCLQESPEGGVAICHGFVYRTAAGPLRDAGIRLLHDEPLPFPSRGHRARFVAGLRVALEQGGVRLH